MKAGVGGASTCLTIVSTRNDERQRVVKRCPVGTTIVALKHILHDSIITTKQVGVHARRKAVVIAT